MGSRMVVGRSWQREKEEDVGQGYGVLVMPDE